jgi:beta-barrel assembly-enhancing protease
MLEQIFSPFWYSRKRWLYGLLSIITALSLSLGMSKPSYSISWFELLLRGVQIFQISNMSDSQEVQLGQQINQQLIKGGKIKVLQNTKLTRYIDEIGQKIVKVSDRPSIPYTFQVVNDKSINAFATMGGFIYLNTGLISVADNEAELASVISHEAGHIIGRHAIKQIKQQAIAQGVLSAAGLEQSAAVQIGVDLALNKPNSREDELEADQLGLKNLQGAGYAPGAMVSFMQKLLKSGASIPTFLSTHPATQDRITALQQVIDPKTANVGNGLDNQAYKAKLRSF